MSERTGLLRLLEVAEAEAGEGLSVSALTPQILATFVRHVEAGTQPGPAERRHLAPDSQRHQISLTRGFVRFVAAEAWVDGELVITLTLPRRGPAGGMPGAGARAGAVRLSPPPTPAAVIAPPTLGEMLAAYLDMIGQRGRSQTTIRNHGAGLRALLRSQGRRGRTSRWRR